MRKTSTLARHSLLMLSAIVGAGTFALPGAFRSAGILVGSLAFWAMALAVLCLHLLYTEVVLARTDLMNARFPGQAGRLLGPWAKWVGYVVYPAKLIGAALVYIILGGQFLSSLLSHLGWNASPVIWQTIFWLGGVAMISFGLVVLSKIDSWMARALILLLLISVVLFIPHANGAVFTSFTWPGLASIPFGAFIFSLIGWNFIPEIAELSKFDGRATRLAVALGSLGAAFLMWLFGIFAYAANTGVVDMGPIGISAALPTGWAWLIPAVGLLAMASSFVTITESFRAMFQHDAGWSMRTSRIAALCIPFVILFFTTGNFMTIVDFVGSYINSLNALLVCGMAWVVMRNVEKGKAWWHLAMPWVCGVIFSAVLLERLWIR